MRIIDLSVPICNNKSEPMRVVINRKSHSYGAKEMVRNAHIKPYHGIRKVIAYVKYVCGKKIIKKEDFPDSEFLSLDVITMPTHMGTHVDSPYHFGTKFRTQNSKTIDELPIDWFFGNGVKIDMRHKLGGELISKEDIVKALDKMNYSINKNDIVLIWTGMEEKWGKRDYFMNAPGMSREATEYLVNQGVHLMGIDAYSFDRSIPIMLDEFIKTRNPSVLWPSHFIGRELEYVHIERMTNFNKIPETGFKVCCFPLKLVKADASWVRATAIIE